jgi:C2H2-type zinc finger
MCEPCKFSRLSYAQRRNRRLNITALLYVVYSKNTHMNQGEPGVDYDDNNLNPLICDLCKKTFDSLDKLGEHQKAEHDM